MSGLLATVVMATVPNEPVMLDMVQNNPGDPIGFQPTKYSDPATLGKIGYTGQVSTGENSILLTADFNATVAGGIWSAESPERAWRDAYAESLSAWSRRAVDVGVGVYWFTDLMVFPTDLVELYQDDMVDADSGAILFNNFTKTLMRQQFAQAFKAYPETKGLVIRTGETYVFDNPYHVGNSPLATLGGASEAEQQAVWADFIDFLRLEVCEAYGVQVFFRTWDNFDGWSATADYYLNVTNAVKTHRLLYFSIKHTAGDFLRNMDVNHQLGQGKHAQIIEVECQREYEGKGAYPNYIMHGVINGFPEANDAAAVGLRDWIESPLVVGLWTWSRGGGWWGPYIKGNELWIDLHVQVVARWWLANAWNGSTEIMDEATIFVEACQDILAGLDEATCAGAVRTIALDSADAVLYGHYCQEGDSSSCWTAATRDDRLGGLDQLGAHFDWIIDNDKVDEALAYKANATEIWRSMRARFDADIAVKLSDEAQELSFKTSIDYGRGLFDALEAGWRVMAYGKLYDGGSTDHIQDLTSAIQDYDQRWAAYQVFTLQAQGAPSVYLDCYSNMPGGDPQPGLGETVDRYRNISARLPL